MSNLDIIKLGVAIDDNRLQIVETEIDNDQRIVRNLAEVPLEIPFDFFIIGNRELQGKLSDAINDVAEKKNFKATRIGFALSRRMVLLKTVTVDPGMTDEEVKKHLDWEAEQFIISPREEYNIAFERLYSSDGQNNRVAFVSVRSKIIANLKEIFARTRFTLSSVDVDVFASMRALNANLNGTQDTYAFVEVAEKGIFSCVVHNKQYNDSGDISFPAKGPGDSKIGEATDAELAGVIKEELLRILTREKTGRSLNDLRYIYLYGHKLRDEVVAELNHLLNTRVLMANPFHHLKIKAAPEVHEAIRIRPDRFLVSVGMAI